MYENVYDSMEELVDERYVELAYDGGFNVDEDPYDYVVVKEMTLVG